MLLQFRKPLILAAIAGLPVSAFAQDAAPTIDSGNTAWILISAALVMLMTPGLAFFYAGMVRRKNVVSTLMKNYVAIALVAVLWAVCGYSLAFSEGSQWIGGFSFAFLNGVGQEPFGTYGIPHLAFMAFQMMFAIITPALISGAIVERVDFKAWLLFLAAWSLLVYAPVAHWVWGPGGWILNLGGLDFAGGLVVHITSGIAGLVAALMFGKRVENVGHARPNDVSMVLLGAALLWFGWFGFNAGSALTAGGLASHAFVTTFLASSAAFLVWMLVDWTITGRPSAVGGAIGVVVGLVVITPAAGFVSTSDALIMGAVGGFLCNLISRWVKKLAHLDDALDVFACHGVGGILGAIMTGLFASSEVNSAVTTQGLLISGEFGLFQANLISTVSVVAYAAIATFVLIKIVSIFTTLRVSAEEEEEGLDASIHGEYLRHRDASSRQSSATTPPKRKKK